MNNAMSSGMTTTIDPLDPFSTGPTNPIWVHGFILGMVTGLAGALLGMFVSALMWIARF